MTAQPRFYRYNGQGTSDSRSDALKVPCLKCGKMVRLADAICDREGPALSAYYHLACLPSPGVRVQS